MSLSLPPLDTIPNNAERSKEYCSSSEIIEYFARHSNYKLFPLFSSQLFGRLPHFPHAVYMVLLENDWVQSNWPFRSCKNPFLIPRLFALFSFWYEIDLQSHIVERVGVSFSLSSVYFAQSRKGVIWAGGARGDAARNPEESGEEPACVHSHSRGRWGIQHSSTISRSGLKILTANSNGLFCRPFHFVKIAQWSVLKLHQGIATFLRCGLGLFPLIIVTVPWIF